MADHIVITNMSKTKRVLIDPAKLQGLLVADIDAADVYRAYIDAQKHMRVHSVEVALAKARNDAAWALDEYITHGEPK